MNKLIAVVITALVLANIYLFTELGNLRESIGSTQIVDKVTVTEFESEFTSVVQKTTSKVVGVASILNGQQISTGSGSIYRVDEDEVLIITNNHVIEKGNKIEILFANDKVVQGELVGADVYTDIAVIRCVVDFTVEAIPLGDSSLTQVGEWVFAVGNPLGFEFYGSVSRGVISGKDRIIPVDLNGDGIDDWDMIVLQTDAAINPGNSGGPLVNMAGEIIGMNTLKYQSDQIEGMGFSIAINEVIPVVEQIVENGEVIRPLLGISATDINEMPLYFRNSYGIQMDQENGLFVTDVILNSAADQADIQIGDIITSFDEVEVTTFKQFRKQLYMKNIGDTVEIEFTRDQELFTVTVVLQ